MEIKIKKSFLDLEYIEYYGFFDKFDRVKSKYQMIPVYLNNVQLWICPITPSLKECLALECHLTH
jgi:hypothetical protein